MKQSINGLIYNTDTMTVLASRSAYRNGNYCGSTQISKTKGGRYALVTTSNGQDCYRESGIEAITKEEIASHIEGWRLDDAEIEALTAEGVLVEA